MWTKNDIKIATSITKEVENIFINKFNNFKNDTKKEERLTSKICKVCYYIRAGNSKIFKIINCKMCNSKLLDIDNNLLCPTCAEINNLCAHCGGEIKENVKPRKINKKTPKSIPISKG